MATIRKIMIIDDEKDFCFFLKHNLQGTGEYSVDFAHDAKKGLQALQQNPPDILLLDITMPGMDGLQLLESVKSNSRTQHIPVIMVTAIDDDTARLKASQEYVEYYVNKPVDFKELQQKIDAVLKRSVKEDVWPR